ncbi:hypothetical protein TNIN_347511 [Trichonephila inaurata madagascariensis]|uniref:Uncharacterized protein n=1 Tax=Trichonephila inaurata madagascariensis TaxID=2747483 RepID=A0A8X7CNG2_9ARAC|nr:hypothetical protein TNIN_347511 [Trichonephila inaurata madagascariensis]
MKQDFTYSVNAQKSNRSHQKISLSAQLSFQEHYSSIHNSSYRPTSRDPLYQDAMGLAATDAATFGGIWSFFSFARSIDMRTTIHTQE